MAPSAIPSCCLTTEQKDALIEAVHERPVIWDCSTPDYQDVQNRRVAFSEVADLLSDGKNRYSGPEMQVEWKKLRDIFNRTLKKVVANGCGDIDVTWRYWNKMQFIADHERSQIFKAMQKWSKKVPSSPASSNPSLKRKSTITMAAPTQIHQNQSPFRRSNTAYLRCSNNPSTYNNVTMAGESSAATNNSASMVQQLADVAQSARELLGMENIGDGMVKEEAGEDEEQEKEGGEEEEKEHRVEDEEEEREEDVGIDTDEQSAATQSFDPLGHILMLGSQFQNTTENFGSCTQMNGTSFGEINGDLPKLLSEWLTKGAAEIAEASNGRRRKGTAASAVLSGDGNGTTMKRFKIEEENHKIEHQSGRGGRGGQQEVESGRNGPNCSPAVDQFEIFGMFIASQVRTLHSNSPQSALKLKRALTELCFQFEAEQEE